LAIIDECEINNSQSALECLGMPWELVPADLWMPWGEALGGIGNLCEEALGGCGRLWEIALGGSGKLWLSVTFDPSENTDGHSSDINHQ